MTTADIIGASGVFILLLAYFLAAINKIDSKKPFYFFLNTIGAAIAGYASWIIGYIPFVVLEGAWTFVSLAGMIRAWRIKENG